VRAQVAAEARMGLDVEEYVASFRPDLADALFQWARGASFAEVAKLSHVFEARARLQRRQGWHASGRAAAGTHADLHTWSRLRRRCSLRDPCFRSCCN
jgi:hypothetical protein